MEISSRSVIRSADVLAGIDVAKDELVCSLVDPRKDRLVWRDRFSNDAAGISLLLRKMPKSAAIAIEPTGRYGNRLVTEATTAGHTVYLAPGRRAKAFQRSIQSRAKTDPIDSYGLALFASSRSLWQYRLKSESVDRIDQHLSYRKQLSSTITRLTLQAKSMPHVASLIRLQITELKSKIRDLDKTISSLVKSDPDFVMVQALQDVPGIGPVTATALVSRLVHKQFVRPDSFVAYIGMDVAVIQSGKRKGKLGMTKEGDGEIRRLLYLAASSGLKAKDSPFKEQYARELAKGHSKTEAICAIARKLAKLAWSMVRNRSEYDAKRIYEQGSRQPKAVPSNDNLSGHVDNLQTDSSTAESCRDETAANT